MEISLRSAKAEDIDWLDSFYERLMRPYVELTHEWDAKKFRETFNPDHVSIVQHYEKDIGLLKTQERENYLYLADIQISEEYQGKGIGTDLIKEVMKKAFQAGMPVRLKVLKGNPAMKLYKRLGFQITSELENSFELEWSSAQPVAGGDATR